MDRHKKCEEERHEIWVKAKEVQDRIKRLEKAALKYPEEMTILSDIAYSYLAIEDIDNAVRTYQKIIELKDSFEHVWDNELGEAYLITKNYEKAIEILENCYLDRRMMFSIDEMTEEEKDRYFELKDLLFADTVIG